MAPLFSVAQCHSWYFLLHMWEHYHLRDGVLNVRRLFQLSFQCSIAYDAHKLHFVLHRLVPRAMVCVVGDVTRWLIYCRSVAASLCRGTETRLELCWRVPSILSTGRWRRWTFVIGEMMWGYYGNYRNSI